MVMSGLFRLKESLWWFVVVFVFGCVVVVGSLFVFLKDVVESDFEYFKKVFV